MESKRDACKSIEIHEIAIALALARQEFETLKPNRKSIDGPFADIVQITKVIAVPFAKHGLAFYQATYLEDGQLMLHTEIMHKSGQWIASKIKLILADTDKNSGAHIDFHKRLQALTLLGLYWDNSFDDDGDDQQEKSTIKGLQSAHQTAPKKKHWDTITKEQYEDVLHTLQDYPDIAKEVMERYGITTLRDMPKRSFIEDMDNIRQLIAKIQRRY